MHQRVEWADYAKGIGIILVVYGHVFRGLVNAAIIPQSETIRLIDSIIYTFHMPLFFFLSGLFFKITKKIAHPNHFWLKKIDTIVYPFILWSLIQSGIEFTFSNHTNKIFDFDSIKYLLIEPVGHFWFLQTLFLCFLITFFTLQQSKHRTQILLLSASVIAYLATPEIEELPPALKNLMDNYVFFLLGVLFEHRRATPIFTKKETANNLLLFFVNVILFIALQYLLHGIFDSSYINKNIITLVIALSGILIISQLSILMENHEIVAIKYLGVASMAIYLAHIIAGSGTRIILSNFLDIKDPATHIVAGISVGIIAPLALYVIVKHFNIGYILYRGKKGQT